MGDILTVQDNLTGLRAAQPGKRLNQLLLSISRDSG
jgi:hypothetical protein